MDYRIEAMEVLLCEDCILQRYFPLIPYKAQLLKNLIENHCLTKTACLQLSDELLIEMGLPTVELANLFRQFLVMYDAKEAKLKEIDKVAANEAEAAAFRQLYLLPGVKAVRAKLYCDSGYTSLSEIAAALPEQIILDTSALILSQNLPLKPPLPKEVRTHIAVAKALTLYAI